jgi:hypothetical protein
MSRSADLQLRSPRSILPETELSRDYPEDIQRLHRPNVLVALVPWLEIEILYGGAKSGGIEIPRSATSPYHLSGLLKCGVCGANLIIVSGYGSYGHHPKYGCSQHFNRGTCSNAITVRRDWLERRLLDELQNQVLKRQAIE